MVKYIPDKGDFIFVNFDPTIGHEQKGYRPALVISSKDFNKYTNMLIVLPVSSNMKVFPTHYFLKDTKKIKGAVLCEQVKSIDYENRKIKFIEKASKDDLEYSIVLFNLCLE